MVRLHRRHNVLILFVVVTALLVTGPLVTGAQTTLIVTVLTALAVALILEGFSRNAGVERIASVHGQQIQQTEGASIRYSPPERRIVDDHSANKELVGNEVLDREVTTEDEVRILFVEDDPAVAQMYKLKLELDGYAVEVAVDGLEAVRMATGRPPDLIFLDIRLPKLDGLGVLEALRQDDRTREVPVVILSSYSEQELIERGLRLGALDYLVKSQATPARVADGMATWLKG